MTAEGEDSDELARLRSNATNLTQCLKALLARIEKMELEQELMVGDNSLDSCGPVAIVGSKARHITTGRGQRESTLRALLDDDGSSGEVPSNHHAAAKSQFMDASPSEVSDNSAKSRRTRLDKRTKLFASAYEARLVTVHPSVLDQMETELRHGEMVIIRVRPEAALGSIQPGDSIIDHLLSEINGERVTERTQLLAALYSGVDEVILKLVFSHIFNAPMEFVRVLESHCASGGENGTNGRLPPYLSFNLQKGDVLQILSRDKSFLQARKVNELSKAGFVPSSIQMERVSMVSPYGRRLLVLLGAVGVGRRTLKGMLLQRLPDELASVVPITSRAPRTDEQQGREYHFITKEKLLRRIRAGEMVEWGEHNGQLYGTSIEAIREVMRSGRLCVVDVAPKALITLYTGEFMPYVVAVASPPYDEMLLIDQRRREANPNVPELPEPDLEQFKRTSEESDKLVNGGEFSPYLHHVLFFNRNREVMLHRYVWRWWCVDCRDKTKARFRLIDSLERLRVEPQWIPRDWMK